MVYIAVYYRTSTSIWPFDRGDDPAFKASKNFDSLVTWGICRQDLRNKLKTGDLVVFFATDKLKELTPARYCFIGFAKVQQKIKQTDIWTNPEFKVYQNYQNLLIRPKGDGYEHFEPGDKKKLHEDWLWRIAYHKCRKKKSFISDNNWFDPNITKITDNFVLFEPETKGTFILENPPVVAEVFKTGSQETWLTDTISETIKKEVMLTKRSLRTTNVQVAHPFIKLKINSEDFAQRIRSMCSELKLFSRCGSQE